MHGCVLTDPSGNLNLRAWTETYLDKVFKYKYSYSMVGYNTYINLEESRFPLSV